MRSFHFVLVSLLAGLALSIPTLPMFGSDLDCLNGTGSHLEVQLTSGYYKYRLSVPVDGKEYHLIGQEQSLGCTDLIGIFHNACLPCNMPVNHISISDKAVSCAFNITGRGSPLMVDSNFKNAILQTPGQIMSVSCDPSRVSNHTDQDRFSSLHGVAIPSAAGVNVEYPKRSNNNEGTDASAQCLSSAQSFNTVIVTDNGVYHFSMPLDKMAHWSWELECQRVSDNACFPCNQIGATTEIMIKPKFGPCIIFTEDHRSFAIPFQNSDTMAVVAVSPANAFSGIECGTA